MSLLAQVATFFFYILFFGLVLFWPLVSSEETGRGFHGLVANVALGGCLTLMGISIVSWESLASQAYIYLSISMLGLILFSLRSRDIKIFELVSFRLGDGDVATQDSDRRDWLDWLIYALTICGFLLWGMEAHFYTFTATAYVLSSMFLIGVTIFMMALGHYYLVVPKLTQRPLVVGSICLWIFLAIKIALSSYAMYEHWDYFVEGSRLGDGFMMNWVFASMRILWGFVALGALNYFSLKLAQMRSFQSATGVLYTMVFFVFVGELLSGYFYHKFGVAL